MSVGRSWHWSLAVGVGLLVALTSATPAGAVLPMSRSVNPAEISGVGAEAKVTEVEVRLDRSQTLTDALSVSSAIGYPVVAYRFENREIVGEYRPAGPSTPQVYLDEFFDRYGTQPQVVAAVVELPVAEAEQLAAGRSPVLKTFGPEYSAPAVDPERSARLLGEFRSRTGNLTETGVGRVPGDADRMLAPSRWVPTDAQLEVFGEPSVVWFTQYYYWDGVVAHNNVLHADDGWEGEINIRTNHPTYQAGFRGGTSCPSGYKDRPFAKNYNWNWAAYVNTGAGMSGVAASVGAYADYNDLQDPCNQSSIAIGLRSPQNLPSYSGTGHQEVYFEIQAFRGLDTTGPIGGIVQAVNETGCVLQPWLSNTDCMGTTTSTAGARRTLSFDRGWTAPNKCWMSLDYGDEPSDTFLCGEMPPS